MSNALLVSSPSKLEMEKIAGWLSKLVHRVQVGPYEREWGIFVPSAALHRARNAFKRVIAAANPPGKYTVHAVVSGRGYVRIGRAYRTLTAAAAYADQMVRAGKVVKAVVLGAKGKLRFAAFSGDGIRRVSANKRRGQALRNPAKLLTQEDLRKLPAIYSQEKVADPIAYVKFFTPWTGWTWYALEFDGKDQFFGLVQGLEEELGYFSLSELMKIRGPGGLRIERDLHFHPTPLSKLRKKAAGNPRLRRAARQNPGLVQVPIMLENAEVVRRVVRHLRAKGIKVKVQKQGKEFAFFISPRHSVRLVEVLIEKVWSGGRVGGAELTTPRQVKKAEAKAQRMLRRRGSAMYRPGEYEYEVTARTKQREGARRNSALRMGPRGRKCAVCKRPVSFPYDYCSTKCRNLDEKRYKETAEYAMGQAERRAGLNSGARRNGTMSSDEAWAALQWVHKHDRVKAAQWRRRAAKQVSIERGPESMDGISSSDVNHKMAEMLVIGTLEAPAGAPWRKSLPNRKRHVCSDQCRNVGCRAAARVVRKRRGHVCDDRCRSYGCPRGR